MASWYPAIQIVTATFGVVAVAMYSLTFVPPAFYRRWIQARYQRAL
jgi:hypothetical protein